MPTKLLAIDDNPGMTELLRLMLRGYGLDVIPANTSELGLELFHTKKPDIITLDLMMPNVNGWKLCRTIRSFSNVPIIIVSALGDSASVASGMEAGANDYLVKPISGKMLIECINKFVPSFPLEKNKFASQ